ncbi:MAG: hypothetical protein AB7O80_09950 [Acetobacteraceae bacterium]
MTSDAKISGRHPVAAVDVEQAIWSPASVFPTPEAVLACDRLTVPSKVEILRRWAYDASEQSVATEEGMPNGNGDLLRRILLALSQLTDDIDVERIGDSKQHGIPRPAERRGS